MSLCTVSKVSELKKLPNPQVGDLVAVEDGTAAKRVYTYTEDKCWKRIEGKTGLNIDLYSLNKASILNLPTIEDFSNIEDQIKEYIKETNNQYYMLLCNDYKYYTLFQLKQEANNSINYELIECLKYLGEIKSIDKEEDHFECWVKINDDCYDFLFFPYDGGVIECHQ